MTRIMSWNVTIVLPRGSATAQCTIPIQYSTIQCDTTLFGDLVKFLTIVSVGILMWHRELRNNTTIMVALYVLDWQG